MKYTPRNEVTYQVPTSTASVEDNLGCISTDGSSIIAALHRISSKVHLCDLAYTCKAFTHISASKQSLSAYGNLCSGALLYS